MSGVRILRGAPLIYFSRAGAIDSREAAKSAKEGGMQRNIEELSAVIVDCGYQLHRQLGPGLLESVYEVVLAKMLEQRGLRVER